MAHRLAPLWATITPLGTNIAVAIEGSFEVMTNANDTITADWGLFDVSGGNVYIFPRDMTLMAAVACDTMLIQRIPPNRRFTVLPAAAVRAI